MVLDGILAALRGTRVDGRTAAAWSLSATESRRLALGTKDAETGSPHAPLSLSEALNARFKIVWDDGLVSRGALDRRQIELDPAAAIRSARGTSFADPDGRDVLGPATFPDIRVHDQATADLARGAVTPLADRFSAIRERVLAHGLRTWSGSFHASCATARIVSSAGLEVEGVGSSFGWHVSFDGEIGAGYAGRAQDDETDFLARLDRTIPMVLALRSEARRRAGGSVPVLLHPDVVEEYVLASLLHNLDGAAVAHGTGAFRREQFGAAAAVIREDLTLRHDPLVAMASGAYRFTQEGLPARPVTLIERGCLATPLLDLKYARRLGLPPTPAPSAVDTIFLEGPEPLSLEAALDRADGGVLVLGVLGVHTQDFTSGDFSMSAPQTLAIGPSGIEGRLRATISGNLFEILRSPELALVRFPGEHTPGLLASCRTDPVHPAPHP